MFQTTQQSFRFLSLPSEVRNNVYAHYIEGWTAQLHSHRTNRLRQDLVQSAVIGLEVLFYDSNATDTTLHLSKACRQIRIELLPNVATTLTLDCWNVRLWKLRKYAIWGVVIPPKYSESFRKIKIACHSTGEERPRCWRAWQTTFPALQLLEFNYPLEGVNDDFEVLKVQELRESGTIQNATKAAEAQFADILNELGSGARRFRIQGIFKFGEYGFGERPHHFDDEVDEFEIETTMLVSIARPDVSPHH